MCHVFWGCFVGGFEDLVYLVSPSDSVSGTGTGFGPLPSRERGFGWWFGLLLPSPRPVVSCLRGNDGPGLVVLSCFTLTFDSSPIKGGGDWWLVWLVVAPPCGYCLEASMTDPAALWIPAYAGKQIGDALRIGDPAALWIPAYAGMTVWARMDSQDCDDAGASFFTLAFDSSPIKEEGDSIGWIGLVACLASHPTLWILP